MWRCYTKLGDSAIKKSSKSFIQMFDGPIKDRAEAFINADETIRIMTWEEIREDILPERMPKTETIRKA